MGNPDSIIESVYRRAYLPFVEMLALFPEVKANLHYTGYLLEWLERRHPELVRLIQRMVDSGQVELMGGGYYEPILPTIPDGDAEGQVRLESAKVSEMFGRKPSGAWTAERAWEPQSPELLSACGVAYTLLDDTIFARSGIGEDESHQPFLVESRGSTVVVFPMSKTMRYAIPWKPPSTAIKYLRAASRRGGGGIVVFGDDGEKFGAWPTTQELVYRDGWLERFLEDLSRERRWLRLERLSTFLTGCGALRRVYLPAASYEELMGWSVAADAEADATGYWRLFLGKYPESARLYAKMLSVSAQVDSMRAAKGEARRALWKGQCNDAYWHGVFGGLYSPVLRRITYGHLLAAQVMAEPRRSRVEPESFGGRGELSLQTRELSVRVCPADGGSLAELGVKRAGVNLLDVVARHKERYHSKIRRAVARQASRAPKSVHDPALAKRHALARLLVYDRYPRNSFLDHLVAPETTIDDLSGQRYRELLRLAGSPYEARTRRERDDLGVELSRIPRRGVKLTKRLSVGQSGHTVCLRYRLSFSTAPPDSKLLVEVNLGSLGEARIAKSFPRQQTIPRASSVGLDYPSLRLAARLDLSRPLDVWALPVVTASQSESGFEGVVQGVSFVSVLDVREREEEFELTLTAAQQLTRGRRRPS